MDKEYGQYVETRHIDDHPVWNIVSRSSRNCCKAGSVVWKPSLQECPGSVPVLWGYFDSPWHPTMHSTSHGLVEKRTRLEEKRSSHAGEKLNPLPGYNRLQYIQWVLEWHPHMPCVQAGCQPLLCERQPLAPRVYLPGSSHPDAHYFCTAQPFGLWITERWMGLQNRSPSGSPSF